MNNSLEKIDSIKTALASITNFKDARKLISIAAGILLTASKEYRASEKLDEVLEDKNQIYNIALKAGELRLYAEAKFGELLAKEQENGRLQEQGRPKKGLNEKTFLKDIGVSKNDAYRSKRIFKHQGLIEAVVKDAAKRGDVPSKNLLERKIKDAERQHLRKEPPLTALLMPDVNGRKIRIQRLESERRWEVVIGPNEAGVKIKEHLEEIKRKPEHLQQLQKIEAREKLVEKLRHEIAAIKEDVRQQTDRLNQSLRAALEKQYGLAYTHTETIEFQVNDEETEKFIETLPSTDERVNFLLKRNEKIVEGERGYWGDIMDLFFSSTVLTPAASGWTRVGNENTA